MSSPDYPLQKKRHSVEYPAHHSASAPAHEPLLRGVPRAQRGSATPCTSSSRAAASSMSTPPSSPAPTARARARCSSVTTLDLENPPRTPDGKVDYSKDFFGKQTSLTVSGQLNAENFAMAFGDVYTFGPTFRAENSNTARHAAEFWMIEPEMAFCDLDGDLEVMEAMVKHIIRRVMERCPDDLAFFNSFVDKGLLERLQHVDEFRLRPRDVHRGRQAPQGERPEVRLPRRVGHRPADRARALPHRADLQAAPCSSPTIRRRSRRSICA